MRRVARERCRKQARERREDQAQDQNLGHVKAQLTFPEEPLDPQQVYRISRQDLQFGEEEVPGMGKKAGEGPGEKKKRPMFFHNWKNFLGTGGER